MKVGRPRKYFDDETRKSVKTIQNRESQRRLRLKKKVKEEIKSLLSSPKDINTQYREGIVELFSKYNFNYFFTGTLDPNYLKKREIKEYNEEIKELNKLLDTDLSFQVEKKIGINSLRKYTERYIQYLNDRQYIKRWFVVFELGKNYKYHIHIMFETNKNKWNFKNYSEDHWLLGTSITEPIISEQDKLTLLSYCVKEFNPKSHKITDMNKMDNWFFEVNDLIDQRVDYDRVPNILIPQIEFFN